MDIIKNNDCFSGYKQTDTYKKAYITCSKKELQRIKQVEQLARLQQLERLQQLQQLEENKSIIDITIKEYKEFSGIKNSIFYLDPPYENATNKYKDRKFDSNEFYDWAFEMSKNNTVIISSYEVSDERFEVVYDFIKAKSTISSGTRGTRTEKLFMVK